MTCFATVGPMPGLLFYEEKRYRATCSCGWRGGQRKKRPDAQADAVAHMVGHEPARKPKQPRSGWPAGW